MMATSRGYRGSYGVVESRARIPRTSVSRIAPASAVSRNLMAGATQVPHGRPVFDDYLGPRVPYAPEVAAPAPAPTPPQTPAQGPGAEPSRPGGLGEDFDYSSDPILQKVRALARSRRATAESAALSRKKQLAVQLGDEAFGRELGVDEATLTAARENPMSWLATVKRQGQEATTGLENDLNRRNLFYSGYRGEELGRLGTEILGRETEARGEARGRYGGILEDLLGAQQAADEMEMMAEEAAYMRALARAQARQAAGPGPGAGPPPAASGPTYRDPGPQPYVTSLPGGVTVPTEWLGASYGQQPIPVAAPPNPAYPSVGPPPGDIGSGSYTDTQGNTYYWDPYRQKWLNQAGDPVF